MLKNIILTLIITACSFMACTQPADKEWVNDYIGLLNAEQKQVLTTELQSLEDSVGSQMTIMIIDTLQGMEISDFSYLIASSWGIGRKDFDDGVLILLAKNDRQMRIEVGLGLEKIITNATAENIIKTEMIPDFKQQKFYEGLLAAVVRIKKLILENKELIGEKNE